MGRPLPGYHIALLDSDGDEPVDEGEIAIDLARPPLGLMTAYRGGADTLAPATRGDYYRTGDVASSDAEATSPASGGRTICSRRRTTCSRRSSSRAH